MKSRQHLQQFSIQGEFQEPYLAEIPALQHLTSFEFTKPVTFLVGENGTGKSTLLEALAVSCGFNPEGGTRNFNFSTIETHSSLYKNIKLVRSFPFPWDGFFLRAESFYNVATEILNIADSGLGGSYGRDGFLSNNYGGRSLHDQSHGESFLALVTHRFQGDSLFFLDEPEAALSPSRQMALLARIHQLVEQNSQFIIATHSPLLMAYPHSDIIELTDTSALVTPYKETQHYLLTKRFLNTPDTMLHHLLK